jgi:flagellar protein FliO/FliZ
MTSADAESFSLLRTILAFAIVLGLLGLFALGLRYVAARGLKLPGTAGGKRRLELVEALPLDARRRLVIVRCDGKEHLLLLGPNHDVIVMQNIVEKLLENSKPACE